LRVSTTDEYTKLWAIDTTGITVNSYMDNQAKAGPAVMTPADGAKVSVNPISGGINAVTMSWGSVPGVVGGTGTYQLDIALDPKFGEIIWSNNAIGAGPPVIAVTPAAALNPGTVYYWRLRVQTPVTSPWGEVRSFEVEATGALSPQIGAPANGATITSEMPAFSWTPTAETTKYKFELATDPSFASPIVAEEVTATGIMSPVPLDTGTYFWRVMALEPSPGEWSTIANFTVAEAVEPGADQPDIIIEPPVVEIPEIVVPAPEVTVEGGGEVISQGLLWAVIIIGAVLVIAVIVLIVRTRRSV
jgi:hypothetical protein